MVALGQSDPRHVNVLRKPRRSRIGILDNITRATATSRVVLALQERSGQLGFGRGQARARSRFGGLVTCARNQLACSSSQMVDGTPTGSTTTKMMCHFRALLLRRKWS